MPEAPLIDLIDMAYGAAADDVPWAMLGERLEAYLGAGSITLWRGDTGGVAEFLHSSPHLLAATGAYARHYHRTDVWVSSLRASGSSRDARIFLGSDVIADTAFRATEFYSDFCKPLGMFHLVGTVAPLGQAGQLAIGCHRPEQSSPFTEADRTSLAALLPHMRRALQLRHRLEQSGIADAARAFDVMPTAALIVDAALRVIRANTAAEMLARDGGLRFVRHGRTTVLATEARADAEALRLCVQGVALLGREGGVVSIQRPAGSSLAALVSPLPAALGERAGVDFGRMPNRALVLMRDPMRDVLVPPHLLSDLYGLSRSEAEVAIAAANGSSAEQIAIARRVQATTIRTQLRHVLAKTGAEDLRGLTKLVSSLSP